MYKMKSLLKIAMAAAVFAAVSCSKDNSTAGEEYLPVTYFNMAGIWELVEWNGEPLADGTFAYIELTREKKFSTYTNLESTSLVTAVETGVYDIDASDSSIGGYYDNAYYELWSTRYVVSEFTGETMKWTAKDNEAEVRVYSRTDAIPDGIVPSDDNSGTAAGE